MNTIKGCDHIEQYQVHAYFRTYQSSYTCKFMSWCILIFDQMTESDCIVQLLGLITLTPYMVLPLFATRFADYAGGIRVFIIQPRLF